VEWLDHRVHWVWLWARKINVAYKALMDAMWCAGAVMISDTISFDAERAIDTSRYVHDVRL